MISTARLIGPLLLLLSPWVAAQDRLNMAINHVGYWTGSSGSPQVIFSDTNGAASFGPRVSARLSRASNPAPPPPYRVVLTLGPGFTALVPLSLPADTSCQPATGGGQEPIRIECVRTTLITGTAAEFQFGLDAGPWALFSGPQVTARFTVDYDAFPLPDPPTCTAINGNSGCVERSATVYPSSIGLNSLVIANPVTVGANTNLQVNHRVVGYDGGRISTTLIDLPAELEYVGVSSPTAPIHTCSAADQPGGGQRVSCTGNIRHPSATGEVRTGNYSIIVRTRAGVEPPGPLRVVASIGNGAHPNPNNCSSQPDQLACAAVEFGLVPPPIVDLRLTSSSAPQPFVRIGPAEGPFRIEYRNAGGAASAMPTRILAQLPAGFELVAMSGSSGAVSCSASGGAEFGQLLRCARSTQVPASSSTFWIELALRGDPRWAQPAGNLIVWAITDGPEQDADAVLACASNPDLPRCRWQTFGVRPPCPGGPQDAIYCDGYQQFIPLLID